MKAKTSKILVAIDGSENSDRALAQAKEYSELVNGEITILTVVEPISIGRYSYSELSKQEYDALENAGEAILTRALKTIDDKNGDTPVILRKGSPADEILKEAEDGNYDLIIMGCRGFSISSKTILGSVSHKVLNHTEIDVFVIK